MCRLVINDFGAREFTLFNNEEIFSRLALFNNYISSINILLIHSINNNLKIIIVKTHEHKGS
jgi:hypothetical protein